MTPAQAAARNAKCRPHSFMYQLMRLVREGQIAQGVDPHMSPLVDPETVLTDLTR